MFKKITSITYPVRNRNSLFVYTLQGMTLVAVRVL